MIVIEKIVAPSNRSSKEALGTVWIADLESGKEVWVQVSQDQENPKWKRLGDLYEELFIASPDGQEKLLVQVLWQLLKKGSHEE